MMNKGKGLVEKSNSHEPYESKLSSVHKASVHGDKGKTYHSKHQSNKNDDPSDVRGEAIHSAHGLNRTATLCAILLACRDKGLSTKDITQNLGLSETKREELRSIVDMFRKNYSFIRQYNKFRGFSNIATEFEASGGNTQFGNNHFAILNMLTDVRGVDNGNANNLVKALEDILYVVGRENNQQDLLKYLLHGCFSVATNGGDDNDPEHAKPAVDFLPFGGSGFPARWLIGLEAKSSNEIYPELLTKEECSVDFTKSISETLDKLSWGEKCEEVCHIVSMWLVCFILLTFRTVLVSMHLKVSQQ